MDKDVWSIITAAIVAVNRIVPMVGRRPKFSDLLILRMYCWTVWQDRPMSWAADRSHYGGLFRPRSLPSRSQFCRRVKTKRFKMLLEAVDERLRRHSDGQSLMVLDGKALPVSESTRDPEAKTGRGNGRFSRGYKLHALGTEDGWIRAFDVRPLNEHEVPVAQRSLVEHIPSDSFVLADGNYDSDNLYRQVSQRGALLLTPLKGKPARSHQRLRRMSPARLTAMAMWNQDEQSCRQAYRERARIERIFSALSSFGGGLGPLPAWVRRLERVRRWVTTKVIIYHARLLARSTAA